MSIRLWEVACHEAAHSVVHLLLGGWVHAVTIKPEKEGVAGQCILTDQLDASDSWVALHSVLAGPLADLIQGCRPDFGGEPGTDMVVLSDLYRFLGVGEAGPLQAIIDRVGAMLVGHWSLVELVARALMEFGTLPGLAVAWLVVEWQRGRRVLDDRSVAHLARIARRFRDDRRLGVEWCAFHGSDGWRADGRYTSLKYRPAGE